MFFLGTPQISLGNDPCCCSQDQKRISSDQLWSLSRLPYCQFRPVLATLQIFPYSAQRLWLVDYCGQIWIRRQHHLKAQQDVLKIQHFAVSECKPRRNITKNTWDPSDREKQIYWIVEMKKFMHKKTWFGSIKSLDASWISAKMFLNAAHPSSRVLPAGTMIVLRFLLTEASDTCRNHKLWDTSYNLGIYRLWDEQDNTSQERIKREHPSKKEKKKKKRRNEMCFYS